MTLPSQQVIPLYSQIKESLLNGILQGEFQSGDQLPSQRELCEHFGASHMTVRRAIEELVTLGYITAIPGKGLFVAASRLAPETNPLISFTEDIERRGMKASSRILDAYKTTASTILAKTLEVHEGTPIIYLRRLRLGDGIPMAIQTCHLVHSLCSNLLDFDLTNDSLYRILQEEFHIHLHDCTAMIETTLASQEVAHLLEIPIPSSVMVTEQITFTDENRPIEFLHAIYRGDRYRFRLNQR
jgi:GntR family transcriptional regulator